MGFSWLWLFVVAVGLVGPLSVYLGRLWLAVAVVILWPWLFLFGSWPDVFRLWLWLCSWCLCCSGLL